MSRFIDLTGNVFGKLTVVGRTGYNKHKQIVWKCECKCGKTVNIVGYRLRYNETKSCGCLKRQTLTTHNLTNTRIYNTWWNIKRRCYNKNNKHYKNYGGRGIKVCDEWLDKETGFMNFYNWAMKNGYSDDLSIDRINVHGNYEPNNCRWVDNVTQQNNRRTNRYISYKGEIRTLTQWSRLKGIPKSTLYKRLFVLKWSIDKALGEK